MAQASASSCELENSELVTRYNINLLRQQGYNDSRIAVTLRIKDPTHWGLTLAEQRRNEVLPLERLRVTPSEAVAVIENAISGPELVPISVIMRRLRIANKTMKALRQDSTVEAACQRLIAKNRVLSRTADHALAEAVKVAEAMFADGGRVVMTQISRRVGKNPDWLGVHIFNGHPTALEIRARVEAHNKALENQR